MVSCVSCVDAAAAIGGLAMATAMASEGLAGTTAHVGRRDKPPDSGMPQDGQGFTLALPQHSLEKRSSAGVLIKTRNFETCNKQCDTVCGFM